MFKLILFLALGPFTCSLVENIYGQDWDQKEVSPADSQSMMDTHLNPKIAEILSNKKIQFTKRFSRAGGEAITLSTPFYVPVNIDSKEYDPSQPLDEATKKKRGLYRAHFALVEVNGETHLRLVYFSGNHGLYRFTDGILYDNERPERTWISKGNFEDFMGVPPEVEQYLKTSPDLQGGDEPLISAAEMQSIQEATPDHRSDEDVGGIPKDPQTKFTRLKILEGPGYTDDIEIPAEPEKVRVLPEHAPDFTHLHSSYKFETVHYGTVTAYQYLSKDSSLLYCFHMADQMGKKGHLAQVYPLKSRLSKWGAPLVEVDSHSGLATPLFEYSHQIHPLYKSSSHVKGKSEENWAYVRNLTIIKNWYKSLGMDMPPLDSLDQKKIQKLLILAMEKNNDKAFELFLPLLEDLTLPVGNVKFIHFFTKALMMTFNSGISGVNYLLQIKREVEKRGQQLVLCPPVEDPKYIAFIDNFPLEMVGIYREFCGQEFVQKALEIKKIYFLKSELEQLYKTTKIIKQGIGKKNVRLDLQRELIKKIKESLAIIPEALQKRDRELKKLKDLIVQIEAEADPYELLQEVLEQFDRFVHPLESYPSCS